MSFTLQVPELSEALEAVPARIGQRHRVAWVMGAGLLVLAIGLLAKSPALIGCGIGSSLTAVVVVALSRRTPHRDAARLLANNPDLAAPTKALIVPGRSLSMASHLTQSTYPWSALAHTVETPHCWVVVTTDGSRFITIPKRALADESDLAALRTAFGATT